MLVLPSRRSRQGEALEVTTKKNLATTTLFGLAVQMSAQEPKLGAEGVCSSSKNPRKPSPQSPKQEVRIAPGELTLLEAPIADVCKDSTEAQTEEKNSQELSEEFMSEFSRSEAPKVLEKMGLINPDNQPLHRDLVPLLSASFRCAKGEARRRVGNAERRHSAVAGIALSVCCELWLWMRVCCRKK